MKLVTKILLAVFSLAILTPILYFMYLCQFKGKCDFISIHDVNNNNTYREGFSGGGDSTGVMTASVGGPTLTAGPNSEIDEWYKTVHHRHMPHH